MMRLSVISVCVVKLDLTGDLSAILHANKMSVITFITTCMTCNDTLHFGIQVQDLLINVSCDVCVVVVSVVKMFKLVELGTLLWDCMFVPTMVVVTCFTRCRASSTTPHLNIMHTVGAPKQMRLHAQSWVVQLLSTILRR